MNTITQSAPKFLISALLALGLTVLLAHSVSAASAPAQARTGQFAQQQHACLTRQA